MGQLIEELLKFSRLGRQPVKTEQVKLDELIRSSPGAHNALLDLEELDEKELERIRSNYEKLAALARKKLKEGKLDTEVPEVEQ